MKNYVLLFSALTTICASPLKASAAIETLLEVHNEDLYVSSLGRALSCVLLDSDGFGSQTHSLVKVDARITRGQIGILQKEAIRERFDALSGNVCGTVRELVTASNSRFGFLPAKQDVRLVKVGSQLREELTFTILGNDVKQKPLTLHTVTTRTLNEIAGPIDAAVLATNVEPLELLGRAELSCEKIDLDRDEKLETAEITLNFRRSSTLPGILETPRLVEHRPDPSGEICNHVRQVIREAQRDPPSVRAEQKSILRRGGENKIEEDLEILISPKPEMSIAPLTLRFKTERQGT